jgi:hypothetical protein
MSKPILLHLGDPIKWNHSLYATLSSRFTIVRSHSMTRSEFKAALQSNKFGFFAAMYRPFWNTGGEMGNWDEELIFLLPPTCKIFASAGAGFVSHTFLVPSTRIEVASPYISYLLLFIQTLSLLTTRFRTGSTSPPSPAGESSTATLLPRAPSPSPTPPSGSSSAPSASSAGRPPPPAPALRRHSPTQTVTSLPSRTTPTAARWASSG